MKKYLTLLSLLATAGTLTAEADGWIRINQLGYLPASPKTAVLISEEPVDVAEFQIVDAFTDLPAATLTSVTETTPYGDMKSVYRLKFGEFDRPGAYYLRSGEIKSPVFPINNHVYDGAADHLLHYMRQQRCGYNPFLGDSCHQHDGYIEFHPELEGRHIDVRGGWHDAGDYLQYTTTSANAIYQMMLAYSENPGSFGDAFGADGRPGANGIPDIIDEVKWGMDWLCRMNPGAGLYFNQIADDRDHVGLHLPADDKVDYGYGPGTGRPVYFVSGKTQPRGKFINATTGKASTVGKFASCFALGSRVLKEFYPEYADSLAQRAIPAYEEGVKYPGVCQTASIKSPYIYEEVNWTDDMELAAVELYKSTGDRSYLQAAVEYGRQEPVTPWMGADSARHYQWYPFMNAGHYHLAAAGEGRVSDEFTRNMRAGLQRTYEKARTDAFMHGIPYIWCSNNLTAAMLTQARLYRELTADDQFLEMEMAMLDWLLGCNPWGTSMIVELPGYGDYPTQPHSGVLFNNRGNTTGGLVDGPVYSSIFNALLGVNLDGLPGKPGNAYARFQPEMMVYHDAIGDYSTNEPTMDGTASLTYILGAMQSDGHAAPDRNVRHRGGVVRTDPSERRISLVFSAHDWDDGAESILATLDRNGIKGAFFFTGDFYDSHPDLIKRIRRHGHYLGSHSDKHLLYMPWDNPDSMLVDRSRFTDDIKACYARMAALGIEAADAPVFMPPYEHYNDSISAWARQMGLLVVNPTPRCRTYTDYTTPSDDHYYSSRQIFDSLMTAEAEGNLQGAIMLVHLGTDPARTDKFYDSHLQKTISELTKRGYSFVPLLEALDY
ncbi:MAG: glycoside hydrolase family 9 protein [Muribaculaceae bacterium]|nr:glycoside hydrolase family 9 protein [Muribaculaceae bacterium]